MHSYISSIELEIVVEYRFAIAQYFDKIVWNMISLYENIINTGTKYHLPNIKIAKYLKQFPDTVMTHQLPRNTFDVTAHFIISAWKIQRKSSQRP